LKNLFIGAEGTLGIVTAAALKLFPVLPNCVTALIAVDQIEDATELALAFRSTFSADLTALELISGSQMKLVAKHIANVSRPLAQESPWYLLIELSSVASQELLLQQLEACLAPQIDAGLVRDAVVAGSETQRKSLWHLRHSVTEANKREGMGLSLDIAVPVSAVQSFLRNANAAVEGAYPQATIVVVGHLGDGNLHYIVMFDHAIWNGLPDQAACKRNVSRLVYDIAIELGGTFSAEHGIGALHLREMARYKAPVELELMAAFKRLLDPKNLMNPGRVLPPAIEAQ
jgi:D-lactate dehydrogenase (cytochrome)